MFRSLYAWVALAPLALAIAACNGDLRFDGEPPSGDAAALDEQTASEPDAGDEPVIDPGTICGTSAICDPGAQYCCTDGVTFECKSSGDPCTGLAITCDDSYGCPTGRICCADSRDDVHRVECELPTHCAGLILCDPIHPECPSGTTCQQSNVIGLPSTYYTCR